MKKSLIAGAVFAGLALLSGCGMSTASNSASATAPASTVNITTACSAVISTGETLHAAYATKVQASQNSDAAREAFVASKWDDPNHSALQTALEDSNAKFSLAVSQKQTAQSAYDTAKQSAPSDCRVLSTLDFQFITAYDAVEQANAITLAAAQAQLDSVQALWDAAKAS